MTFKPIKRVKDKDIYPVNLHSHCGIGSLGDAFGTAELWIQSLERRGIKHHMVTDHGMLTAIPWMHEEGKKHGITIHPGMEGYIIPEYDGYRDETGTIVRHPYRHIVLLPMNDVGWKNLIKINNTAWREGHFRNRGRFSYDTLFENNEGLICLSACLGGIFSYPYTKYFDKQEGNIKKINKDVCKLVKKFKSIFEDRLYIEIMINHYPLQLKINQCLLELASAFDIKTVITNDCHYPEKEYSIFREAIREMRYKSSSSDVSRDNDSDNESKAAEIPDLYPRSVSEIRETWHECGYSKVISWEKVLESIGNIDEIVDRCNFSIDTSLKLPTFDVKSHPLWSNAQDDNRFEYINSRNESTRSERLFIHLISRGYKEKMNSPFPFKTWKKLMKGKKVFLEESSNAYIKRLWYEYNVIKNAGFIDYFLIVGDIIRYCTEERGHLYGKGRGSVAGSVISWFLGISRDDPIKYELYFERFLNAGRLKGELPDIDMDFPSKIRDDIKGYIANKYGINYVVGIGTIGEVKIKSAIVKMASVQDFLIDEVQYDFHSIQQITHTIPTSIGGGVMIESLDDAINVCSKNADNLFFKFYQRHKDWLENTVKVILDHPVSYGRHAAGVIISTKPIDEAIPIRIDNVDGKDVYISQWRDKDLLPQGFLKLDILGLTSLDQIEYAYKLIGNKKTPTIDTVDRSDKEVYKMIRRGDTAGVFQLNSKMFQVYFKELRPKKFDHIFTTTALLRPGPLAMEAHKHYAAVENGQADPIYLHKAVKPALKSTAGLMVFQEELMQICVDVCGFTLEGADELRSIVGKKKRDKMPLMHDKFVNGAINNNFPADKAEELFKSIEAWAGYGFNKAHAVSYSGISYYQAWLKCHYPSEYWASKLQFGSENQEHDESVWAFRSMMLSNSVKFAPISVNTCSDKITVDPRTKEVFWRLDLIKEVSAAVASIIAKCAPYISIKDLLDKTHSYFIKNLKTSDAKSRYPINKRHMVALISAGAFDPVYPNKTRAEIAIEYLRLYLPAKKRDLVVEFINNNDFAAAKEKLAPAEATSVAWALKFNKIIDMIALQHEYLRFTDRPYWRVFASVSNKISPGVVASSINRMPVGSMVNAYGMLKEFKIKKTKKGDNMILGSITEFDGNIDFILFPGDLSQETLKMFKSFDMKLNNFVYLKGSVIDDSYTQKHKIRVVAAGRIKLA